jgi:hypothetical protein
VKRIYLENNLRLEEGTGRQEIDIDLEPAREAGLRRVMLFGRNGSGKSTLLRVLNPFPGGADAGGAEIVPGRPGRKIVEFARPDGAVVAGDIRWSRGGKPSCFLSVDGEILENTKKGNLGEYLAEVKAQLGVTEPYLKIGRIGGKISGFLEMKPGPRKAYIGQFMPEVEEWSVMHRQVSKRLLVLAGELKGIQVELERIEPREVLDAEAERAEADRSRASDSVRAAERALGAAQATSAEIARAKGEVVARHGLAAGDDFNPAKAPLEAAVRARNRAESSLAALVASRPALAPFAAGDAAAAKAEALRGQIANVEGQLVGARQARSSSRSRLDGAISAGQQAAARLRSIQESDGQIAALEARLEEQRASAEAAEASPALRGGAGGGGDLTYDEVKAGADAIARLTEELEGLRRRFSSPDAMDAAAKLAFDPAAMRERGRQEAAALRQLRERRDAATARIAGIEAQSVFHRQFHGLRCADPRCPYEPIASQFSNVPTELADKRAEAAALDGRIAQGERIQAAAASDVAAAEAALAFYGALSRHRRVYEAAGVWGAVATLSAFAALVASPATAAAEVLSVRRMFEAVSARRDLSEARRVLASTEERLAGVRALAAAREQFEQAAAEAGAATEAARAEFDAAEVEAAALETKKAGFEAALALVSQIVALHDAQAAAEAEAGRLADASAALEGMRERWDASEAASGAARLSLASAREAEAQAAAALQRVRMKLGRRDDYEARLAAVDGRVARGRAIADACHPARGAPVEFIRDFLDVTRDMTNGLLDVAMGGEFRIRFELTDSEFLVPVMRGSGRKIPDVLEVSDGQFDLAKTVISLALIKQTMMGAGGGGYNVLALDEPDGTLDRERNREKFAEILSALEQDLGISQTFLISHNDVWFNTKCGLILFPGHSMPIGDPNFMEGKIILADLS